VTPVTLRRRTFPRLSRKGDYLDRRTGATEESTEPAPANSMDSPAGAGSGHLFGKVTIGLVDALSPEHPRLVLTCETHSAPPTPTLDPPINPLSERVTSVTLRRRRWGRRAGTCVRASPPFGVRATTTPPSAPPDPSRAWARDAAHATGTKYVSSNGTAGVGVTY
jgi:hypothetical protein